MTIKENNYCIILAGGLGRRLWPCSRQSYPKQFMDFFGVGKSQLQQTFERFAKFIPPSHIFVNTDKAFGNIVSEQLPQLSPDNILQEPIQRNTAPSVAWAAHRIQRLNPQANIIISPSDQIVLNEEAFQHNVLEGLDFVSHSATVLTMGVKPTRPEPGYGYIQVGNHSGEDDIYKVKAFIEKPEREFAQMFMDSGEWCWNTGMFLANVQYLLQSLRSFLPSVLLGFDKKKPNFTLQDEYNFIQEYFPAYPNISIESGILEKSDNVYVQKCDFGWADVGTWHGVYEAMSKTKDDNVVIDSEALLENAHNNVIKLPKGRLAVINGLDGYIVAEKDNVLFICKREDSSSLVKKYVNELKLKRGDEFA